MTENQTNRVALVVSDLANAKAQMDEVKNRNKVAPALRRTARGNQITALKLLKIALESALWNIKFLLAELQIEQANDKIT
jgi:hypothetical protein